MSLLNKGDGPSPNVILRTGSNSSLFKDFKGFIKKNNLIYKGASILVAVSGGPDSVCLLSLLVSLQPLWDLRIEVAHFNHKIRSLEAEKEADFVKSLCYFNKIRFHLGSGNVKELSKEGGLSIQEAARMLRYDYLKKIRQTRGLELIATAHTADDQAEELLFRIIRGAGLDGISGIKKRNSQNIVRPLLFARKKDILSYLHKNKLQYVIDSSNLTTKYTRNKIRQLVLRTVERELNPAVVDTLARVATILQEDEEILNEIAFEHFKKVVIRSVSYKNQLFALDLRHLLTMKPAIRRRIFKFCLKKLGFNERRLLADHLFGLDRIANTSKTWATFSLPFDFMGVKSGLRFFIIKNWTAFQQKLEMCRIKEKIDLEAPETKYLGPCVGILKIKVIELKNFKQFININNSGYGLKTLLLDADKLSFPLKIRARRPGDRFVPLGLRQVVKLKDFYINRKVPKIVRDCTPILEKDGEIVAVCNIEVNEKYKVTSGKAIQVMWEPEGFIKTLFFH